jgi:malate dehydrogenase
MQDWIFGTREGDWVSMGVPSNGCYGIPPGVIYSFPVTCQNGRYKIVEELETSPADKERMQKSYQELLAEQEAVEHLLA